LQWIEALQEAHVHVINKTLQGLAATAALGAVLFGGAVQLASAQAAGGQGSAPAPKKNYKDQGEFEVFDAVVKDVNGNNFAKAVTDLGTWTQKYPQSDFKDERALYYLKAYSGTNQPAKVLEIASQILPNAKTTYNGFDALTILNLAAFSVRQLPSATPEQLAIGEQAAQQELEFIPTYFVSANKPAQVSDDQWGQAKAKVESDARTALLFVAMLPGSQAATKKDYETAEKAYIAALEKYPDCPQVSYALGGVQIAQLKTKPEKVPLGIYQMARAASLDPAKWNAAADVKSAQTYLDKVYTQYHGADAEGLQQLKQLASQSPMPPAGFAIKTVQQVSAEKEEQFKKSNPQLAFWMGIKGQLADTNGEQYYESNMKGTEIAGQNGGKAFKGTLLEGKPACRSKELVVALSDASHGEVTLKLETALTGKPQPGEIQFDGAPSAFTKDPFMLTMDTDKSKIDGLKTDACAAARPGMKKGVASKKK
jgi:hypothetical protein